MTFFDMHPGELGVVLIVPSAPACLSLTSGMHVRLLGAVDDAFLVDVCGLRVLLPKCVAGEIILVRYCE